MDRIGETAGNKIQAEIRTTPLPNAYIERPVAAGKGGEEERQRGGRPGWGADVASRLEHVAHQGHRNVRLRVVVVAVVARLVLAAVGCVGTLNPPLFTGRYIIGNSSEGKEEREE